MKRVFNTIVLVICVLQLAAQPDQDGPTKYFFPNGKVSSEGVLLNGKPEGFWKNYYDTGVLRSEGNRDTVLVDSLWRFYAPDGSLQNEINYAANKKNGASRSFDTTGVLVSEELYVNDLRDGMARYFHPNGIIQKEVPFKEGKEEGKGYEYAEDGRVVSLLTYGAGMLRRREDINRIDRQGLKQGPWKEFHPNGKVRSEGNFVDGKEQGVFKSFDEKGSLKDMIKYDAGVIDAKGQESLTVDIKRTFHPNGKVSSLGSYSKSGKKEGLFKEFAQNGDAVGAKIYVGDKLISEGAINNIGALEGPWTEYFASGEKRAEGSYTNGRKEGDWTFYHKSGKVEQKGVYMDGLPQGTWQWFYEDGRTHRQELYRKGKEDGSSVEYDELGKVITQGEYIDGLKEGMWFYEVGDHREEGAYKEGLKDGEWRHTYVEGGKKNFVGSFVNGEPNGKHKWYWPNGQLKYDGRFSMGLEQGDFEFHNEQGIVIMTTKFKNGVEVKINGEKIPPPYEAGTTELP